jgi:hypothetical protein
MTFVGSRIAIDRGCRKRAPCKMAMGVANAAMSNGDMRTACKSFFRAQKMGSVRG